MIKEDFNLEYEQFLEQYVFNSPYDFTITFKFNGVMFQFDFVGVPKNSDGSTAYDFIEYDSNENEKSRCHFKSLKEAVDLVRINDLDFKTVYYSENSELVDAS